MKNVDRQRSEDVENVAEQIDLRFKGEYIIWVEQSGRLCTTCDSARGKVGDYFLLNGEKYVVTRVRSCKLVDLCDMYISESWWCAHCIYMDFRRIFYPDLDLDSMVYTYFFQRSYEDLGIPLRYPLFRDAE